MFPLIVTRQVVVKVFHKIIAQASYKLLIFKNTFRRFLRTYIFTVSTEIVNLWLIKSNIIYQMENQRALDVFFSFTCFMQKIKIKNHVGSLQCPFRKESLILCLKRQVLSHLLCIMKGYNYCIYNDLFLAALLKQMQLWWRRNNTRYEMGFKCRHRLNCALLMNLDFSNSIE